VIHEACMRKSCQWGCGKTSIVFGVWFDKRREERAGVVGQSVSKPRAHGQANTFISKLKKWSRNCPHPCGYIAVEPVIRANSFFRDLEINPKYPERPAFACFPACCWRRVSLVATVSYCGDNITYGESSHHARQLLRALSRGRN
jgi:hypothetical protein